MNEEIRLTYQE